MRWWLWRLRNWLRGLFAIKHELASEEAKTLQEARRIINRSTGLSPTYIVVGETQAKIMGLPGEGAYRLTNKGFVLEERF